MKWLWQDVNAKTKCGKAGEVAREESGQEQSGAVFSLTVQLLVTAGSVRDPACERVPYR